MKKLNKLYINPEKVMKNDELVTLRGGYGTGCCECKDWNHNVLGYMTGSTPTTCNEDCFLGNQTGYGTWECII
jgi:hypothetical protein